jgi:hypothetical protein
MGFLSKYKTDKTAETAGVWVEIDVGVELKIARINNEKARNERRALEKPYRNFAEIPAHVSEDILRKVVARTVLLDWKGVTDADGADLGEYDPAKAEKLFKDFPDFLNDVVSLSVARETFQTETTDAVKNG